MEIETSSVAFGRVVDTFCGEAPLIWSPPVNSNVYVLSQAHVPVFFTRQVLTKDWPGLMMVLSRIVTFADNTALFVHATVGGTAVGGGGMRVAVGRGTGVSVGVGSSVGSGVGIMATAVGLGTRVETRVLVGTAEGVVTLTSGETFCCDWD